jgi:hypothetical protein
MGQDGEHRFAQGALYAPDGETAEAKPRIMGVARETPAATTAGLVVELKAQGEEKGEDEFDKCLPIAQQLKVGGLIVEIDGDGAVFPRRFGGLSHVSPSIEMAIGANEPS